MTPQSLYGGIEAGGTKFVCAIGNGLGQIVSEIRIETTSPDETLGQVVKFFKAAAVERRISRIGVGCFGPLDLDPASTTYGFITVTPKPGWSNLDILGTLQRELGIPVVLDTDVDAAALAEFTWGAGKGFDPLLYLTIGTGIGGGLIKDGAPFRGMLHPEMGHIRIPHDLQRDPFPGSCPFHGDCLEGLASGPAISSRLGTSPTELPDDNPYWGLEAEYIALALQDFILTLSPRRVILGGGIMDRLFLIDAIRARVMRLLNGYVRHAELLERIDQYILPPGLGSRAGVLGGVALASISPG